MGYSLKIHLSLLLIKPIICTVEQLSTLSVLLKVTGIMKVIVTGVGTGYSCFMNTTS